MPKQKSGKLPKSVDWDDWLEENALDQLPSKGVFFAVAYDRDYPPSDPLEALEACPLFTHERDAHVAAYELARGNMPRAVLRCEIVSREKAHQA